MGPGGTAACLLGPGGAYTSPGNSSEQPNVAYSQNCLLAEKVLGESNHHRNAASVCPQQREAGPCWSKLAATGEASYSFRSPESVEMDEIMAAMVLTSLSCSPVVQNPAQVDAGPGGASSPADMECGGGELSDSGSSGYWSWDHGNGSPAPSPSVTEVDSSPDEGLQMELEQADEINAKKNKNSFKGVYKCLWPACGKVLTSSVGIKRHIRVLHLGNVSDQSQREEDFYFTKISFESAEPGPAPSPSQQQPQQPQQLQLQQQPLPPQPLPQQQPPPPGPSSCSQLSWTLCGSPPASGLQIPPAHRPRSNSSSGPSLGRPTSLSQSAPSSFWQIHSEHLYQACSPVQVPVASKGSGCQGWTPSTSVSSHTNVLVAKPRCRSVSVGEQWLQQNRLQPMSMSPSRTHCTFRKGRGEAKKCRKVYGVERKDQWCTACRWKKACQRFPD